ncbi:vegetative incompatibility protein HET-E-1 [Xylariaceae sp. AK1471]|nr:vegetative incompatibility protein HET-E-1 [Xylariaceae sp. AK1471]
MRLLYPQKNGSLALTEDLVRDIPPYVILSHTWGHDNQEVTFKDISDGTGQHKEGYQKIEFCLSQAASDGLQYVWVDTCCIDKSNNTELSEAINSMFRWYKNAVKCYVYLSDVSKNNVTHIEEPLQSTWEKEFRESRWFTRGWTLQELLAPSSVEFFAVNGQRLGDKKTLERLVHEITGIAIDALRGGPLSDFGINMRMSWSKGRETKKEEDKAYSLFGIFGIYMPLIYGEGEEEAFRRLWGEIDRKLGKPVLDKLPIAVGAAFDSHAEEHNPTCLPDTRVNLLREISDWIEEPEAKAIFWLNGMAGTGKSTISRSLAHSYSDRGQLGASFFFKRGEDDRKGVSKFFSTIAAQLVRWAPALAIHVKNAIDADPAIFERALRKQFEKLILKPLSTITPRNQETNILVIVIDALDECDRDEDVRLIIYLLSRASASSPIQLRIFLTSRPELPIRLGFQKIKGTYQDLTLHEIQEPVITHDLFVYFKHELTKIRKEYNDSVHEDRQLLSTWPEQSNIKILATMATPLFIFAATTCRFIADRKNGTPDVKLRKILEHQTKSQESKLDATYLPVLDHLLVDLTSFEKMEVLSVFQRLVGSIVVLTKPLSAFSLAHLLDIPQDTIDNHLDSLHSVLSIPLLSSSPVRLLHLSFRDFLTDPLKCSKNPFWVNEKESHRKLAINCIRVMSETLQTDICEIKWPGTPSACINLQIISDRLAPEVRYACQYWVYHIQQAGDYILADNQVYCFLRQHFLHWLEALSIIERALESLKHIEILRSLYPSKAYPQLSHFLDDALRFALTNISIIQEVPLQIYSSALAFAPRTSTIRQTFRSDIPNWISLSPQVNTHWSNYLRTLEGHSNQVSSATFSPDGEVVASGSWDNTVRLWSAVTGACLYILEGHSDKVSLITFSPDSKVLASGSEDCTVCLWSAATGARLYVLEGHSDTVNLVTFSPDSKVLISGSRDFTVRLWSAASGACLRTFGGQGRSVAFSSDGRIVASGSTSKAVQLWSAATGEHLYTLKGHYAPVKSIAFSPDSKVVALNSRGVESISWSNTVQLWSAITGKHLHELEGHKYGVESIAFSPDGGVVVSGSWDQTVRLWSAVTGEHLQTLKGHYQAVTSVAFSPDGRIVISGSEDRTVRLWSAATGEHLQTLKGHSGPITSVAFSPNGEVIISGSQDNTVRLWSAATSPHLRTPENYNDVIRSVAFLSDGKIVASGSEDNTVHFWSAATGEHLRTLKGHSSPAIATSVAFSPDGTVIASGFWDHTVQLWSAVTGEHLQTLRNHGRPVTSIAFSPNSRVVASGSYHTVQLWAVATGTCLYTLDHVNAVNSVAFSPDGEVVASSSQDKTVRLWSATTGKCLRSIDLGIYSSKLSFDQDGKSLLTNAGAIFLGGLSQSMPIVHSSPNRTSAISPIGALSDHDHIHHLGHGIGIHKSWVTLDGRNLLWLPVDYRSAHVAFSGSTVAIGCPSGRIAIMRFSKESLVGS